MLSEFNETLLHWYQKNKRDLPWRGSSDPYEIWVAEIMSQQTQIQRVAEDFFPRFIEKFPTIKSLAKADWEKLYPYWRGLGFYYRGRLMLQTAKKIVAEYHGIFPADFKVLCELPGIGKYTAAAIASFAFGEKIPAIDTNLMRIIRALWPEKNLVATAYEMVEKVSSSRDWNEAMMDFCDTLKKNKSTPKGFEKFFTPEALNRFFTEPKKKKTSRKKIPKNYLEIGVACITRSDGSYLVQTRPEGKSFSGEWEFPGGKKEPQETIRTCIKREIREEIGVEISVRPPFFRKTCRFLHTTLRLTFHRCQIQSGSPKALENQKIQWILPENFGDLKFLKTNAEVLEKLKRMKKISAL